MLQRGGVIGGQDGLPGLKGLAAVNSHAPSDCSGPAVDLPDQHENQQLHAPKFK